MGVITGSNVKETSERYSEIADWCDLYWSEFKSQYQIDRLREFEQMIGGTNKKILDAGCGTGRDSGYMISRENDVYSLDISHGMIEKCKKNLTGLESSLFVGDIMNLGFKDGYFDGIWTNAAIVHLTYENKMNALKEFRRVLKDDGTLYVWVKNLLFPKQIVRLLQSYIPYLRSSDDDPIQKIVTIKDWLGKGYTYFNQIHWFYPTKVSMLRVLRESGFSVVKANNMFSKGLSIYSRKS